jgi:hypothetical protein
MTRRKKPQIEQHIKGKGNKEAILVKKLLRAKAGLSRRKRRNPIVTR